MQNRSEYTANIQLVNTSTFSRGVSAKRKSSVSAVAVFVLVFGAIGFILAVAFFAG